MFNCHYRPIIISHLLLLGLYTGITLENNSLVYSLDGVEEFASCHWLLDAIY